MKTMNFRKPQINHTARTITITETFQRASATFGTEAFSLLMEIMKSCPGYTVICVARHKPARKTRLTYDKMGKYISCLRNGTEYLKIFEKVKAFAKSQPNPYLTVSRWFDECFPDYGCVPEFDEAGFPLVEANVITIDELKDKQSNIKQLSATSEQKQSENEELGA